MGKAYSLDLRERVWDYISEGHSCRAAGRMFGVSAATAVRIASDQRKRGSLAPKPQGRPAGRFGKLAGHMDFLVARVQTEPDITLAELCDLLEGDFGIRVQPSSIHRALQRVGFSYKKGLIAQERDRPLVRHLRHVWLKHRLPWMGSQAHRLVFIDETAVKTNLTRLRGRALRGERLYGTAPFGK